MEPKRVVITGMGVITPIGLTIESYWNNLLSGKSGVSKINRFDATEFDTKIAAQVHDFNPGEYISKKEARRMDLFTQFAMASAKIAMEDSEIDLDSVDKENFGVLWGSGIGGMQVFEDQCKTLFEKGPNRVSPFLIPMLIPDIAAGRISIEYGLKGVNYATVSACSSSAHAIGEAFNHIRYGKAIAIVAGGSEAPITKMGVSGFCSLKALTTRNDEPEKASRPFDLNRDGFVIGEGGGAIILEDMVHAKARNAKIYAEIVGVGYSADAYHITQPVPGGKGAKQAMLVAVKDADIDKTEIDYINAHGTSTPYNDKVETQAIKNAFGDHAQNLVINSTKSMSGHLLGASGVAEAVACILSLQNGKIHPTANLDEQDPECDLYYVPNKAIEKDIQYAMSNSFGFGGHNVSLVLKKYI